MFRESQATLTIPDAPSTRIVFSPAAPTPAAQSAMENACPAADGLRDGIRVPLDTIHTPGAYICNWSGHLLRIPQCGLTPAGPLAVNIVGGEPLIATKISDDPAVPLALARRLAWQFGVSIAF